MPLTIESFSPELTQSPLGGRLFHYTDNSGFLGIARTKTLWATDSQHLNDRSEYSYACNLVKDVAKSRFSQTSDNDTKCSLNWIIHMMENSVTPPTLSVISFSENNDQLSQWRAYGRDMGYAISFDFQALKEKTDTEKWLLVRCEYDANKQRQLIGKLIDLALKEPVKHMGSLWNNALSDTMYQGETNIRHFLQKFGLIFKNGKFSEEKEWRLISPPLRYDAMNFRLGRSGIIPYHEFELNHDEELHPIINWVIVGPQQEQKLASEVAGMVFTKYGIRHFPPPVNFIPPSMIQISSIPYRSW
ncbi:MAG: DUF2971 domain-containing protein [Methylovulum sp.]|nr:DUF2971 domain-containing protein [Methylovulum sp.]